MDQHPNRRHNCWGEMTTMSAPFTLGQLSKVNVIATNQVALLDAESFQHERDLHGTTAAAK